jgi:hypothetical protein
MISSIRSGIQKAGYKYIVWTLLIVFAFSGTGVFIGFLTKRQGQSVATVNGYSITPRELRAKTSMFDQRIKDFKQQFGQHANYFLQMLGLTENPEDMAFKELVREKLLTNAVDNLGLYHLSPDYVGQKLCNPTFTMQHLSFLVPPALYTAAGQLDERTLKQYLHRQNISYSDFEEHVEGALKQYFILSMLPSTIFISQQSVNAAIAQEKGNRTFSVATIDLDDYVAKLQKNAPSEQELQQYFNRHNTANKRYWSDETREGKAWKFEPAAYGITISDAEVKQHYEQNKQRYSNKKLEEVRKDIEKELLQAKFGRRFSDDARRLIAQNDTVAIDEFIKKHGGKQILFDKHQKFNPDSLPVSKLFSLKKGKTGMVVGAQEGYLVTLNDIEERKMRPFQEVKKEVERDYMQEKAAQELAQDVKNLMKDGSLAAFEKFAKERALAVKKMRIATAADWEQAEKNGLPSARMKKMVHAGYGLSHPAQDGVKIIFLETFEPGTTEVSASEKEAVFKKLRQQELQFMPAAFILLQ